MNLLFGLGAACCTGAACGTCALMSNERVVESLWRARGGRGEGAWRGRGGRVEGAWRARGGLRGGRVEGKMDVGIANARRSFRHKDLRSCRRSSYKHTQLSTPQKDALRSSYNPRCMAMATFTYAALAFSKSSFHHVGGTLAALFLFFLVDGSRGMKMCSQSGPLAGLQRT